MKLIIPVVASAFLIYGIFFTINSLQAVFYPYGFDDVEGFLLHQASEISKGGQIYQSIDTYPFLIVTYTPFYLLVNALLIRIAGPVFWTGRLISFLSAALVAFLIYSFLSTRVRKWVALLSAFLFFFSPFVLEWSALYRVDLLGLLLSFSGIYLLLKSESKRNIFLASVLFTLSFFTKQSFLAAPLSSIIYLFLKQKKKGILLLLLFAAMVIPSILTANALTNGEFVKHAVFYNVNKFSAVSATKLVRIFVTRHFFLMGLSLAYVFSRKKHTLLVAYFVISTLFTVTSGKEGATINYFLEPIAIASVLFGLMINKLAYRNVNTIVLSFLIIQLFAFVHFPFNFNSFACSRAVNYTKTFEDPLISEDPSLLILANKSFVFEPYIFSVLSRANVWNQSVLINDINKKHFSAIIFYDYEKYIHIRFTKEFLAAVRDNYALNKTIGDYSFYTPKN